MAPKSGQKSLRGRLANRSRPGIEVLEFRVTPTTFHVNSLLDTVAVSLKTGKDASGQISLRSAIQAADAKPNADTIILPAGTITLTIAGPPEDNAASGDLDVRGNLTIKGKGAGATVIDGNNLDRVFQMLSGTVAISGVTIQHGLAAEGGGLLNSGGKVTLTSVSVVNNLAIGSSGAAGGNGVTAGSVGGDGSAGGAGGSAQGGGIANAAGSLTLNKTFVASNQVIGGAGGNGGNGAFGGALAASQEPTAVRAWGVAAVPAATAAAPWAAGYLTRRVPA